MTSRKPHKLAATSVALLILGSPAWSEQKSVYSPPVGCWDAVIAKLMLQNRVIPDMEKFLQAKGYVAGTKPEVDAIMDDMRLSLAKYNAWIAEHGCKEN